jgi:hypothetical protein
MDTPLIKKTANVGEAAWRTIDKKRHSVMDATVAIPKFKFIVFLTHFACTIALLYWFLSERTCGVGNRATWYSQTKVQHETRLEHWNLREHWAVLAKDVHQQAYVFDSLYNPRSLFDSIYNTCKITNGTREKCQYKGIMPTVETSYIQNDWTIGGVNNMVFLMLTFEWVTVGFALDYIGNEYTGLTQIYVALLAIFWNMVYALLATIHLGEMPFNNMLLVWIVLIAVLFRQIRHVIKLWRFRSQAHKDVKRFNGTTTRYFEYSLTAPLLMIAVHGIVTQAQVYPLTTNY